MATANSKLKIYTSTAGQLGVTADTTIPVATKTEMNAIAGPAGDFGFIPIVIDGTEYLIPLVVNA